MPTAGLENLAHRTDVALQTFKARLVAGPVVRKSAPGRTRSTQILPIDDREDVEAGASPGEGEEQAEALAPGTTTPPPWAYPSPGQEAGRDVHRHQRGAVEVADRRHRVPGRPAPDAM